MCEAVRPHLRAALEADAASRGATAPDADLLAAGGLFARMVRLQTESADWML